MFLSFFLSFFFSFLTFFSHFPYLMSHQSWPFIVAVAFPGSSCNTFQFLASAYHDQAWFLPCRYHLLLEHRWACLVAIPVTISDATSSGSRPQPSSITDNVAFPSLSGIDHSGSSTYHGYMTPAQSVPLPDFLPIKLQSGPLVKKPTHSKRRSNNSIERSILTSSQRFVLLKRETDALWWRK